MNGSIPKAGGAAPGLGQHRVPLVAAFAEQALAGQPDADEDQRHGELVGDVLEVVADLDAGLLLHFRKCRSSTMQDADIAGQHAVQGALRELRGGPADAPGMGEELQHGPVEFLHAGVAGQPDPADRPPLVPGRGDTQPFGISRRWNSPANASTEVVLPSPGNASMATAPLALSPSWALLSTMSHRSSCSSVSCGVLIGPRLACHSRR